MPSSTDTKPAEVQPTSAAAWKSASKEGQVISLPSGKAMRVKRSMDLMHLLKAGRIPNPLSSVVKKMMERGGAMPDQQDLDTDAIAQMMDLVDKTVVKVAIEPKVEDYPEAEVGESDEDYAERMSAWSPSDPNIVPLSLIELDDRMFIFLFAQGFASDLEAFRKQTSESLASVPDGALVPAKAKRASRGK